MNVAISLCLILVGLCTITQGHHDGDTHNGTSVAALKLHPSTVHFALELYKELSSASPGKNILFSPIIISAAFSLLSLGAKSATHTQILEGLSFNLTNIQEKEIHNGLHDLLSALTHSDNEIKLDIGQALFVREQLKLLPEFLDHVNAHYTADILPAKFQEPKEAEKQINDYVEKKTHGKIMDLVKDLAPETALVIISYILFQGNWEKPFDPQWTREEDFFVDQNTTVRVPMMQRMGWFHYYFDEELSCVVVRLDYSGTAKAFFVLPDAGKSEQLEKALSEEVLAKWAEKVQRNTAQVHLPKFNMSTSYELKEPLKKLGITDVFSDHADLSGITDQPLKVSKVTHKAVLALDEKGTVAAAAGAVEAMPMSMPPTIRFNHPFLGFIVRNNVVLFAAKIVDPSES
ncbi:alpha-1-antiproteinase 2-like [Elgaria multicarinata webbii]|uniref:alpha-1-antiproteinase 2-like n=1 Tax=Elgaria multicarinata webbii TaxID=159646 RepID=UPI002FCCCA9F